MTADRLYVPPAQKKISSQVRNFRDLSKYCEGYIKPRFIFRSSSLIPYQNDSLYNNLKLLDVNSIIDLRSEIEYLRASYNDWFLRDIHLYWVHLDISMPDEVLEKHNLTSLPFYKQFIWYILHYNQKELRRIFSVLANKKNYSIVIHCHEGRDRTGIIAALILLLLDVPEENIIQDYLASDMKTQYSDLEFLLAQITNFGGIREYLKSIYVTEEMQSQIRKILAP